ncbi:hypothetical protein BC941DRAFT_420625 [Chlamydoabsidia padenii]|nr:hypothetical protein BC941DRAFT_420625 [Chlamydoabsidia padenii]
MKFNTALISIAAMATCSLVHAIPIDKRDDANSTSITTTPAVQQPSYTASANNAHYSAVASITILGPDGQPLSYGGKSSSSSSSTSDASSVGTFVASYVLLPAAITGYMLL